MLPLPARSSWRCRCGGDIDALHLCLPALLAHCCAGDLASTIQAFVVPGLFGIVLATRSRKSSERQSAAGHWADGAVGGCALTLGLALFLNGILQRLL